jgi:HPt (histidine-containing phosphotransfer) domain-containing protein
MTPHMTFHYGGIMTVEQAYSVLGGDYNEVIRHLQSDDIIKSIVEMFIRSTTLNELMRAAESRDIQGVFDAAHSLRGVALNLSLTKLAESAGELTEALRGGTDPGQARIDELVGNVKRDYDKTVMVLEKVQ